MEIYDYYDRVNYNGYNLTNILRKITPIQRILRKINVYYPYTIKEGERADAIAYDYYGSSTYTWLIYICNNILDPYYQWPLDTDMFYKFIENKYGDFYQTQVDIKQYINKNYQYTIDPSTFHHLNEEQQFGWEPQTVYQWEFLRNEAKRRINLISNEYLSQIDKQVRDLLQ